MKLWGGRFAKETDQLTDHFNSSISFDMRLYKQDILGSIAHVTMLGNQNIIAKDESIAIIKGLEDLLEDIEKGTISFNEKMEDIHMNIEALLTERIGSVAKKMHTGRSRNDQVALDVRLYTRDEIVALKMLLKDLMTTILELAENYSETIMPGYTHLQRAQPITFGHHLMAYFEMLKRDYKRLDFTYENTNFSPLGSGALATTTYPLDRDFVFLFRSSL